MQIEKSNPGMLIDVNYHYQHANGLISNKKQSQYEITIPGLTIKLIALLSSLMPIGKRRQTLKVSQDLLVKQLRKRIKRVSKGDLN